MGLARQLGLLLWKNYVLRKRRILATICEMALPLLLASVLVLLRMFLFDGGIDVPTKVHNETSVFHGLYLQNSFNPEGNISLAYVRNISLAYVPGGSKAVQQVAEDVRVILRGVAKSDGAELSISALWFDTEQQLEHYVRNDPESWKVFAAVVFKDSFPRGDSQVSYHLRFPSSDGLKRNSGFLPLQHVVDRAVMRLYNKPLADSLLNRTEVLLSPFPVPAHRVDLFSTFVTLNVLPLLPVLGFFYASVNAVRALVQEKESRLREYMRMMGVSNWLHLSAWFLTSLLCLSVSVVSVVALLCTPVELRGAESRGSSAAVLNHSDPTLVLLFLLVSAVATVNFSFMISAFFSQAHVAGWAAALIYALSYLPHLFLSRGRKTAACLMSNVAVATGGELFATFEAKGTGIRWSRLFESASVDRDVSLAWVLGMLLLDAALYALVAWYVEAVFPGEYGVPLPYHFFALASYWRGSPRAAPLGDEEEEEEEDAATARSEFMEEEPTGLVPGVAIKHLTKEFNAGDGTRRQAVRDLTVNIFEGQITALLGHNGAGKTTTLSMLTGLFPPTSGAARVNGYDIRRDMALVHRSLGLCPQHDILFDDLTVGEHLLFYAHLKGLPRDRIPADVDRMLGVLSLRDKRHALAGTLSGGTRRKLSIGVALSGGSKVVLLDEPTTGMDVSARRAIWDLLQGEKRGRTVVITTHHMDEADRLGDRVAIMSGGELRCCGSPLFLKGKYGAGYHLAIVKDSRASCDVSEITRRVRAHVPDAVLESNVGAELSYALPKESVGRFESLFAELEADRERLGVASYGASITTMEEVFLRVGKLADSSLDVQAIQMPAPQNEHERPPRPQTTAEDAGTTDDTDLADSQMLGGSEDTKLNTGLRLCMQQFYAMFLKRALYTWRNWKLALGQFLVPLVFVILVWYIVSKSDPTHPPHSLDLGLYGHTKVPVVVRGDQQAMSLAYASQVKKSGSEVVNDVNDVNEYILTQAQEGVNIDNWYVVGAVFDSRGDVAEATAYYNDAFDHAAATSLMTVDNALFERVAGSGASIQTVDWPLPRPMGRFYRFYLEQRGVGGFRVAAMLMLGMASLSSTFALLLVTERRVKSKHLQQVSGLYLASFWFSALLWDLLNFLLACVVLLAAFGALGVEVFVADHRWADVLLILMLYGWAVIPLVYLLSFLFDEAGTAYTRLTALSAITGVVTVLLGVMHDEMQHGLSQHVPDSTKRWFAELNRMFLIFPNYCLGRSFFWFYDNYKVSSYCTSLPDDVAQKECKTGNSNPLLLPWVQQLVYQENYLSMSKPGVGRFLVPLAVQGAVFIALVFVVETQSFWTLQRFLSSLLCFLGRRVARRRLPAGGAAPPPEDVDVAAERERVLECQPAVESAAGSPLILRELSKAYGCAGALLAVDRLSLAVGRGECFGLLGFNGAGKTSTFKMLTGDIGVTSGDAYVGGHSVLGRVKRVQRRIGYCPQSNALLDHMTGRETLRMYARLRGVPEEHAPGCVRDVLRSLLLEPHADRRVGTYSGGTKRKLCTGVSLLAGPPVIFLDEPSAGMDPVAKRLLWDTVAAARDSGKAVVVSTHDMEECEALCTRLAVMVGGRLMCLGSPQHLKSRFGGGYTLQAKVARHDDVEEAGPEEQQEEEKESNLQRFKRFVEGTFPGCALKGEHQGTVHYHLPTDEAVTWARVFGAMEAAKEKYGVEDYCVSQISLEQVFLGFAQVQEEHGGGRDGMMENV